MFPHNIFRADCRTDLSRPQDSTLCNCPESRHFTRVAGAFRQCLSKVADSTERDFAETADLVCASSPDGHPHTRDRRRFVLANDGTRLAVREVGPIDADLTFVFVHGLCLEMQSWSAVQCALTSSIRTICYDQRGHGESGCGTTDSCTIDQLGQDLATVVRSLAAANRIVLVGHSMGGMSILAYTRQHRNEFGSRIVGVALLATAANGLTEAGLGTALSGTPIRALRAAVRAYPKPMRYMRTTTRKFCSPIASQARRLGPKVAAVVEAIANDTDLTIMCAFLAALTTYDEARALPNLGRVPVVIICGSEDPMTPPAFSHSLAEHLPHAHHVTLQGAGHMVQLERPTEVVSALRALVERVSGSSLRQPERSEAAA